MGAANKNRPYPLTIITNLDKIIAYAEKRIIGKDQELGKERKQINLTDSNLEKE